MAGKLPVAMGLPKLPDPTQVNFEKPGEVRAFMTSLVTSVGQHLMKRPSQSVPQASRMFLAPDGTVYNMKVDNDGVPVFEVAPKKPGG